MKSDPYVRLRSRELYRNPWLAVEAHDIVHPNGVPGEHVVIVIPKACAIVVEDGGDLLFTRQPRFGARRNVVEVVKGGSDPNETSEECARRELREEMGIAASVWRELGSLYEIPSIVNEPLALFLASDLRFGAADPERHETIETVRLPIRTALQYALDGVFDDAVTVAALFRYAAIKGFVRPPS
ncbi:MAG: NUDIX hydrolase [Candidatus Eremiobacteraeota bacterium]|nr:NUDIX hydrolase [Candidatus Eremiobacteraeota bacterium]MBV8433097.1 NUDIX hydrolase [Candidatus Eremiobacteraeota bacterium]MBV8723042.1 NUDIX hydrolase [Candidatus Eremiobacteraeota bacterium]